MDRAGRFFRSTLFPWLVTLYEIWRGLDEDCIYNSSLVGMGELLKYGCTTCMDHHYVFPKVGSEQFIDQQFRAADDLGIRFHATRGSAAILGRTDIGSLEVGKAADLFLLDVDMLELAGAKKDPACMLGAVGYSRPAKMVMVNGRVVVEDGRLLGIDEEATYARAEELVDGMLKKSE